MTQKIVRRLNEFGGDFSHHHEAYGVEKIRRIREQGGVWELGRRRFHFPGHFGFCYGVDKAIDLVFETCRRFLEPPGPERRETAGSHAGSERAVKRRVFLTDQLIHNPYINSRLQELGVRYLKRGADHLLVADELTAEDVVVVSAFGTDFRDLDRLRQKGVTIVDTTCGAIVHVWKRVEEYARDGFITLMHGKRKHEETLATLSHVLKENGSYISVENREEATFLAEVVRGRRALEEFAARYPGAVCLRGGPVDTAAIKIGMANQTTMLKEESYAIQDILRQAFLSVFGESATRERFRSFETICAATQDRQDSLRELLVGPAEVILIVGGFNSSNTTHLAEIAALGEKPFYHIESENDLLSPDEVRCRQPAGGEVVVRKGWMLNKAGQRVRDIGMTSGASTPDITLHNIVQKIAQFSIKS